MSGTARFAELVKGLGTPEPYTLWVDPMEDREFQTALRQKRVLTVRQGEKGSKRDYSLVGYHPEGGGRYLLFPKSLQEYEGRKIIGIKYGLVTVPKLREGPAPSPRAAISHHREGRGAPVPRSTTRPEPAPRLATPPPPSV